MYSPEQISATLVAALMAVSLVGAVAAFGGVATVAANHPDDAPDMTDDADFVVNLPHATDHLPGNMNEENGSIQYFASGAEAFHEQGAEDGVFIDWVIVHAEYEGEDWIDYSACDTPNTEAFGIDRGNNNDGVEYDEDLVSRQRVSDFRDDGIVIEFYEWQDFGGNPPYMAPEDAIVAAQGAGSAAGACLTLTDEPGWYRISAFMNGTVADNGPDERPSEDAPEVSLELNSNYLYVCDCEDEQDARETLGPPPDETDDSDDEPESTPVPSEDADSDDADSEADTDEESQADDSDDADDETDADEEQQADDSDEGQTDDDAATGDDGADEDATTGDESDEGTGSEMGEAGSAPPEGMPGTPTPGDGPGFGAFAALSALLAAGLLAGRHR